MKKIFFLFLLLAGTQALAQRTISGTVIDALDKEGIPGVQIVVRGTTLGTITDIMGRYTLNVSNEATHLEFRFLGMRTEIVAIGSSTTIDITMESDATAIEGVEIVSYGSARKFGTTVGSAQQVTSAGLQARPVANVMDALQGQVAGLQVFSGSGDPSATQSVRLHGLSSLGASSTPLVVVDGIQMEYGSLQAMNSNDFESVTILKDASATSIYGSRAANGVMLITTKRGIRNQDARVSVRTQYGVSKLAERQFFDNLMSTSELLDFYADAYGYFPTFDGRPIERSVNTNWIDYFMKTNVPTMQTDVSIQGGSERTMYFLSGGHFSQEGTAHGSFFNRYTARTNIESQAKDWLKIGFNAQLSRDNRRSNPNWGENSLGGGLSFLLQPWLQPQDPESGQRYDMIPGGLPGIYHPVYAVESEPGVSVNSQLTGSFFVEITPFKGLKIINRSGTSARDWASRGGVKPSSLMGGVGVGNLIHNNDQMVTMTTNTVVEYSFNINDDHSFTVLGGQEGIQYNQKQVVSQAVNLGDDRLWELGYGNPQANGISSSSSAYAYLSFFARADYGYKDKYFFDVSLRNDASSRFGKANRNAQFWAIGGMWNMMSENFMQGIPAITGARFKTSYGTQGNSSIGNYTHLPLTGSMGSSSNYAGGTGLTMLNPGDSNLTWENQSKFTIGLTAQFFNKYNIEVEFYRRNTTSMLMSVPQPYTTGFGSLMQNIGALRNTGVDVILGMDILRGRARKSQYFLAANVSFNYNREEIVELFDGKQRWEIPNTGVVYVVGSPTMHYYPIYGGIDRNNGRVWYYVPGGNIDNTNKDPNNTTQVYNPETLRQNTGKKRNAPINGGFGIRGGWKGFSVNADFAFVLGKWMFDNTSWFGMSPNDIGMLNGGLNQSRDILDYWKQPGDNTKFPDWSKGEQMHLNTSYFLDNASFMRMKNLTLSYNLSPEVLQATRFFSSVRVFVTARNLFTITNYMGIDPEVDANSALGTYGNSRQYQIGLELTF